MRVKPLGARVNPALDLHLSLRRRDEYGASELLLHRHREVAPRRTSLGPGETSPRKRSGPRAGPTRWRSPKERSAQSERGANASHGNRHYPQIAAQCTELVRIREIESLPSGEWLFFLEKTAAIRPSTGGMLEPLSAFSEPAGRPAFAAVFREHAPMAWRALRHMGVHEADLKDVSQEVFLVVHRKLASFDGTSTVRSWVYGICIRVASDYRRAARRRREVLGEDAPEPSYPAPQQDLLEHERALAWLDGVLGTLDEAKRAVFVLFEMEELSHDRGGSRLGMPGEDGVCSAVRRAKARRGGCPARADEEGPDAKERGTMIEQDLQRLVDPQSGSPQLLRAALGAARHRLPTRSDLGDPGYASADWWHTVGHELSRRSTASGFRPGSAPLGRTGAGSRRRSRGGSLGGMGSVAAGDLVDSAFPRGADAANAGGSGCEEGRSAGSSSRSDCGAVRVAAPT